jgi:hypothetical protein
MTAFCASQANQPGGDGDPRHLRNVRNGPAAAGNPNHDVMTQLERQHTTDEAAVWVVGSVAYVCPEYEYMPP